MDAQAQQDRVFRALADPTRREILAILSVGGRSVGALRDRFEISQPAVSQHLKVLRESGLVSERKVGRQRIYELDAEPLRLAQAWLEEHIGFWASRFERLGDHLRKQHGPKA